MFQLMGRGSGGGRAQGNKKPISRPGSLPSRGGGGGGGGRGKFFKQSVAVARGKWHGFGLDLNLISPKSGWVQVLVSGGRQIAVFHENEPGELGGYRSMVPPRVCQGLRGRVSTSVSDGHPLNLSSTLPWSSSPITLVGRQPCTASETHWVFFSERGPQQTLSRLMSTGKYVFSSWIQRDGVLVSCCFRPLDTARAIW